MAGEKPFYGKLRGDFEQSIAARRSFKNKM
jgi:hypothetical protein